MVDASEKVVEVPRKWYEILNDLHHLTSVVMTKPSVMKSERDVLITSSLKTAVSSAMTDDEWNGSGIKELLSRALEMASRGSVNSALKTAVDLLDFHFMVEKYRGKDLIPSGSQSKLPELQNNSHGTKSSFWLAHPHS
jgi:hypothetical protein